MGNVNRRYANTVATTVLVFFILFMIWREDASFIVKLALENLQFLSDRFYGFTPKFFLIITMYIVFRIASFLFVDVVARQTHRFYNISGYDFQVVRRMLKLVLWTVFAFLSLTIIFENNFGTVITSLGLVGFGITFALQKPILNFVGWLTISLRGIYKIGDRIKIGQVRGDVREIAMMNTVIESLIETADVKSGKIVTVPNELVLTGDVENYTKGGNYIVNELPVTVTYESDLKRAEKLLYDIASRVTTENKNALKKALMEETQSIEQTLLDLGQQVMEAHWRKKRKLEQQMQRLAKEEQQLKDHAVELEEEFKPRVRIELRDSGVELLCYFTTPYDQIRANRTKIYRAFLEAIAKEPGIQVAYPHMELLLNEAAGKVRKT